MVALGSQTLHGGLINCGSTTSPSSFITYDTMQIEADHRLEKFRINTFKRKLQVFLSTDADKN